MTAPTAIEALPAAPTRTRPSRAKPRPPRACAVCGVQYAPRRADQLICRQKSDDGALTPCAKVAEKIRWYRAALAPEVAAKYGMTPASVRTRLDALLARVRDRTAFDRAPGPRSSRRVSLAGAPVIRLTDAGEAIYATADGGETIGRECEICHRPFAGPPGACGELACQRERRRRKNKDWCAENKERHTSKTIEARKRRKKASGDPAPPSGPREKPDPWTAPPPAWEGPLPGAVLPIDLSPAFTSPEKLGTGLHAVLTRILREGRGHDPRRPEWSLLLVGPQTSSGWAVWLPDEADVEAVRGKTFEVHLRGRACRITLGARAALRLKPPRVAQTGRHRVRITTVLPVCMRVDGGRPRSYPQTPGLWTALRNVAERIGLAIEDPTTIGVMRVSHATEPVRRVLNEKREFVATGWSGDVVVDVNPLGRWLLEVGARIGLGGRTAYGLGRVEVREEPASVDVPAPAPEPWEIVVDQAAGKFAERMAIALDEARVALLGMIERATYERETTSGCEVWRAGDVLLVAQPTTLRTLRIVDVILPEPPVQELWRQHAA